MAIFEFRAVCLTFSLLTREVVALYCYYTSYYYYYSSFYYCPTYYYSYYYSYYYYYYYSSETNVGAIIGIAVGSIVGFIIFISVIVAICCACKKSSGMRGTVVRPVQPNIAVVQAQQQQSMGSYPPYNVMQNPPPYPSYAGGQPYPPPMPGPSNNIAQTLPPGYVEKV